ncbi:hypothetical protein L7F22_003254 [Adiantum nelumboides]|nr:hypothetical protein [Adiantum nelumboides]
MLFSSIFSIALLLIISIINFTSAYTITFVNKCSYTVWPAIGAAPNGQPNQSIRFGARLNPGQSVSHGIDDHAIGVRGWGRTGCDGSGANCKTGACNGDLVCNDAGITSHAILSEYGYGANNREYWNCE